MAKMYRTAQGTTIDIEQLRLQNELVPALGNMKVNARGDQLGEGGKIIRTREEIMNEVYTQKLDANLKTAQESPVQSRKNTSDPIPTSNKGFVPGNASADNTKE